MTLTEGRIEKFTDRYCLRFAPGAREEFIAECQAIIAEPEAERDALKERNETLEAKMERAMIAVAHFTHRYNEDMLRNAAREAENARLRKIIEDAPHDPDCHSIRKRHLPGWFEGAECLGSHWTNGPCDCWKAALARIPEAG